MSPAKAKLIVIGAGTAVVGGTGRVDVVSVAGIVVKVDARSALLEGVVFPQALTALPTMRVHVKVRSRRLMYRCSRMKFGEKGLDRGVDRFAVCQVGRMRCTFNGNQSGWSRNLVAQLFGLGDWNRDVGSSVNNQ